MGWGEEVWSPGRAGRGRGQHVCTRPVTASSSPMSGKGYTRVDSAPPTPRKGSADMALEKTRELICAGA